MEHGVGDGWRNPHQGKFADALHTQRVDVGIVFLHKDGIEIGNVSIDGHEIVRQIRVDDSSAMAIRAGVFHECHANASDHAADALAPGYPGINDAAGAIGAHQPAHANQPEVAIHGDFNDDSAESLHGVLVVVVPRLDHLGPLQNIKSVPRQNLLVAFAARRIGAQKQPAVSRIDLIRTCPASRRPLISGGQFQSLGS
jgi:hypothetical protein